MAWFDSGWGLVTIIVLPLTGALVVAFSQPKSEDLIKGVAFFTALSTFMLSVLAARRLSPTPGEEIVVEPFLGAVPGLADRYYITSFGIRLPILVLFGLIGIIVVIYSWKQWQKPSHAKALVMATLLILDIFMLELIFEEGTPPVATAGLLAIKNLHVAWALFGVGPLNRRTLADFRDRVRSHPERNRAPDRFDVFEEDMSGLVR